MNQCLSMLIMRKIMSNENDTHINNICIKIYPLSPMKKKLINLSLIICVYYWIQK